MLFGEDDIPAVEAGWVVRVAFDGGGDNVYDYVVPEVLWPVGIGQRVEVPFGRGNKCVTGFCVAVEAGAGGDESAGSFDGKASRAFRLKAVRKVVDAEPLLNDELMKLGQWISHYYLLVLYCFCSE